MGTGGIGVLDVASGKSASASSNSGSMVAANAVDGNSATIWSSASAASTHVDEITADAPIAWWRCGEASGNLADSSGSGYTASPVGSPTYGVTSLVGDSNSAIRIDATGDYFTVGDAVPLRLNGGAFSIELWLHWNGQPSASFPSLLSKGGGTTGWMLYVAKTNAFIGFKREGIDQSSSWGAMTYDATHHVVITWAAADSNTLRFYVDGQAKGTKTAAYTATTSTGALTIGTGDSTAADVTIDEVAIYDKVLTPARISAHYTPTQGSASGEWIQVDLGEPKTISSVRVNWDDTYYAPQYKVQTSSDASSWTDVQTATQEGPAIAAGKPRFIEKTGTSIDWYYVGPTSERKAEMNAHFKGVFVYGSVWDPNLSWATFPAFQYEDCYAIYVNSQLASQHPEWILKDNADNTTKLYIPWDSPATQYAADPGNQDWRNHYIAACQSMISNGYDGIFVDDFNIDMNVGDNNYNQVTPRDPRTGSGMTDANWQTYMADFAQDMRDAMPNDYLIFNTPWFSGGGLTGTLDSEWERAIGYADAICIERGVVDDGLTGGTGNWSVWSLFRFCDLVHALGTNIYMLSYATTLTQAEYNLAAQLLIASDGYDWVGSNISSTTDWWAGYDSDLGIPIGARSYTSGTFRRDFTNGVVFLREPSASTENIDLGSTYINTGGQEVTSISLAAKQGAVLITKPPEGGAPGWRTTDFTEVSARYVRLYCVLGGTRMALSDFEVYGEAITAAGSLSLPANVQRSLTF